MVVFFLNVCFLFLPIAIYIIYLAYERNCLKKQRRIILSILLIFEVFLYYLFHNYLNSLLLINIPLLISYLKRKELTSIILSIIISCFYIFILDYNIYFIFFEYTLYFVIFLIINRKYLSFNILIYIFIFIKSMILSVEVFYIELNNLEFFKNFLNVFLEIIIFYISSYLVFIFLLRGEEIMNLNTVIRELEKEKVLRTSLFKMTHEIKNPIAVCKGYLDMLDITDKRKVEKYIPIIKGEIERTLTLMDDYLEYTKVKINKEIVDIYMLLDEVITSLNLFFKENNIKIKMNLPDDELYLNIDYNRIKQVLVNVLKNAHEAMDQSKGKMIIKIETKIIKDYFEIIITDNGIGMDDETLNNITNLFFTTKRNGTGLGTSLSKEILELHGGKLKYESTLGVGTKVRLLLPL